MKFILLHFIALLSPPPPFLGAPSSCLHPQAFTCTTCLVISRQEENLYADEALRGKNKTKQKKNTTTGLILREQNSFNPELVCFPASCNILNWLTWCEKKKPWRGKKTTFMKDQLVSTSKDKKQNESRTNRETAELQSDSATFLVFTLGLFVSWADAGCFEI